MDSNDFEAKVERFAARLREEFAARIQREYPGLEAAHESRIAIHYGKRWTRVDIGSSGKYMVDTDGTIHGIKAYGVPHPKHIFGTLDTIAEWDWSGYRAIRKAPVPRMMPGQTPYTPEEFASVKGMVADAAAGDPGEANE